MSSTNWDSHHPARWVVLLEAAALVLISQLILKYVLGRGEGSVYSAVGALVVVAGLAYWQKRRDEKPRVCTHPADQQVESLRLFKERVPLRTLVYCRKCGRAVIDHTAPPEERP